LAPFVSSGGGASDGQFRKLDSPTLQDMLAAESNKENVTPPLPPPSFTPLSRRRCSRRSSIFTPSFRKHAPATHGGSTANATTPHQQSGGGGGGESIKKARKLGGDAADGINGGGGGTTGQGRIIPIKQGYLYKKSGSSRIYRRKYVTLCSDGTITYYPSFQAYVDMVHGKEIRLQHVTVKIPGQKPTGLRSAQVSLDRLPSASAATTESMDKTHNNNNNNTDNNAVNSAALLGQDSQLVVTSCSSSSSSDECEKEVGVVAFDEGGNKKTVVEANSGKTPKRKRHRLSDDGGSEAAVAAAGSSSNNSSMFELVIVSLESRQWQFQLCSQEEGEEWVAAIQQQIHTSLKAGSCHRPAAPTASWQQLSSSNSVDELRQLPGNDACADCGAPAPGWASLNLGTLICIECSGIHRQLGSHITKVRSLDLDSWSESHLALLRAVGNSLANSVWEAQLSTAMITSEQQLSGRAVKPSSGSCREAKEAYIKSKYLSKTYAVSPDPQRINTESLVIAIER
jgi:Arf-GAP/GTPase/ANK repeat/PH domain-containing protein 1/3